MKSIKNRKLTDPPADIYKLEPVSQFRIQRNVHFNKENRGKKIDHVERDTQWLDIDNQEQCQSKLKVFPVSSGTTLSLNFQQPVPDKKNLRAIKESIQDARVSNFIFQKFMTVEYICYMLTILSFLVNVLYTQASQKYQMQMILSASSGLSLMLMLLIIARYYYKLEFMKEQKTLKYGGSFFYKLRRSGNLFDLLMELAVIILHPNVLCTNFQFKEIEAFTQLTIEHEVNSILALLLLLRVYLIMRCMVSYTIFASPRASRLCRIHLCDHNIMFSVKCLLKEYPLRAIIIIFLLLLLMFGHGIKLAQSPLAYVQAVVAMDFRNYWNCFWSIMVTMGTIGYGDYYPRTLPGRIVMFMASICGVLLSSMLIVALSSYLNFSTEEHRAHICIKRLLLQKSLRQQAKAAVLSVVKFGKQFGGDGVSEAAQEKKHFDQVYTKLKISISQVKQKMRKIKSLVDNNNLYQQMLRYFTILKNNFNEIYNTQSKLKEALLKIANMSTEINVISFAKTLEEKTFEK